MEKLHLNESILFESDSEIDLEDRSSSGLINALIKSEWEAIDLYNSMLMTFKDVNNEEAITTIEDIIKEEYVHVGQLEKLLQKFNPEAEHIDLGVQEEENKDLEEPNEEELILKDNLG